MAHTANRVFVFRAALAILVGGLVGGFLGIASAQQDQSGWLNADCSAHCAAAGYDAAFCQKVCWVPDPAEAAEGDRVDWKCFEGCTRRGGKARDCVVTCRR